MGRQVPGWHAFRSTLGVVLKLPQAGQVGAVLQPLLGGGKEWAQGDGWGGAQQGFKVGKGGPSHGQAAVYELGVQLYALWQRASHARDARHTPTTAVALSVSVITNRRVRRVRDATALVTS